MVMGDVREHPQLKRIREVEQLANRINERKRKNEDYHMQLEALRKKCDKYNLDIDDYYTFNMYMDEKPGWG